MRGGALLLRSGLRSGLLDRAGLSRSTRIVPEQQVQAHDARLQESVQKSKEAAKSLRPTTDSFRLWAVITPVVPSRAE